MLVIGARGFLGSHVARTSESKFEVVRGNQEVSGCSAEVTVNLKDEHTIRVAFGAVRPAVVVLLAAIADIDRCEQFPDEAHAVNLRGAELVANACSRTGARLVFSSTAAVFDGKKHGYVEEDPVSPVSVYGATKAEAERAVMSLVPNAIVLRISLALGFAQRPGTNALLDTLRLKWADGQSVGVPSYEQRNPIDAGTFAEIVGALLEKQEARGIFHVGCLNSVSRFEIGLKLASRMGYNGVVEEQRDPIPGRAPRGPDHYLLTDKLRKQYGIAIPTCDQVIERCFDGLA
jgi:dTDP-4-dehydrorhamnose reductase